MAGEYDSWNQTEVEQNTHRAQTSTTPSMSSVKQTSHAWNSVSQGAQKWKINTNCS